MGSFAGTPLYMSPETIKCKDDYSRYTKKTDIWFKIYCLSFFIDLKMVKNELNSNDKGR